ncbi:MAG: M20/M25/M40 family metallo-hydrolase [Clostridia bacterium]|nr:M20/M25/M40 family metallo-hydrolase [Clostridia bacterium]
MKPELILSDLIKIDSTNPPGNEKAVALYLKKLFEEAGIVGEIIEPEEGRGSFIARIGSGPKKLLYVSHADVVPVGEGWDFEPFSGEIKNGVIYGRGALDCKDLMAAQVSAALQLIAEKIPLQGELIIAVTADEEKGGRLGAGYLADNHPDMLAADYAVNEGADQPIMVNGKMIYFLQVGEKGTAWCTLKAHGTAGHGSVPTLADNAVVKMARAVSRLHNYRAEIVLTPEVEKLLRSLAELCGIKIEKLDPNAVDALLEDLPLEKAFVESLRSMTRMTVSPNMIRGGTKTNIVPDYCEADIDIRILPGQDCDYVEKELRLIINKEIEIEFNEYHGPTFSSSEEPFYILMEEVTLKLAESDAVCLPVISAGSTDSKYLRNAGISAYGIGHMARNFDQQARTTVHGKNERTDVASLQLKTAFLKELAHRYLS